MPISRINSAKTIVSVVGKNPEEIRRTFNIKNDFTPEEEEQVRYYFNHYTFT